MGTPADASEHIEGASRGFYDKLPDEFIVQLLNLVALVGVTVNVDERRSRIVFGDYTLESVTRAV